MKQCSVGLINHIYHYCRSSALAPPSAATATAWASRLGSTLPGEGGCGQPSTLPLLSGGI